MGWKNINEFTTLPEYQTALQNWGSDLDVNTLWHLYGFVYDLQWFVDASLGYYNGQANTPELKQQYVDAIRWIIRTRIPDATIKQHIANLPNVQQMVTWSSVFFPEFWEWSMEQYITKDLPMYCKAAIGALATLSDPKQIEDYKKTVRRQLEQYAPDDWTSLLPQNEALEFVTLFYPERTQIEKAAMSTPDGGKLIGVLMLGGFLVFGLSLLKRKRKA